jgi:hypothetical protein
LDRYKGDRKFAFRLYTWNLAVSSAMWGPISMIEIAVRNTLHDQLVERTQRGDWWADTRIQLCRNERNAIESAVTTLPQRTKRH